MHQSLLAQVSLVRMIQYGEDQNIYKIYRLSKREDILNNFVKEAISKIEIKKFFNSNRNLPPSTM